jgi:hypothetical protein
MTSYTGTHTAFVTRDCFLNFYQYFQQPAGAAAAALFLFVIQKK